MKLLNYSVLKDGACIQAPPQACAYLERRAALASSPDASGAADNRPVLTQSCQMRSVRMLMCFWQPLNRHGAYTHNGRIQTTVPYWADSPAQHARKPAVSGWRNPHPPNPALRPTAGFCKPSWPAAPQNPKCSPCGWPCSF